MEARNPPRQSRLQDFLDEKLAMLDEKQPLPPLMRGKMNEQEASLLKSTWKVYALSKEKKEGL